RRSVLGPGRIACVDVDEPAPETASEEPAEAPPPRRPSSRPPSAAETPKTPSLFPAPDPNARAIVPQIFGVSDVGRVRDHNEDSFLVARLERSMHVHHSSRPIEDGSPLGPNVQGYLFIVADGMGGHAAGEVASAMAVDLLGGYAYSSMLWTLPRN